MLIFGTGEFAQVAKFYFSETHKITGFTIDDPKESSFDGLPLIPWAECSPDEIFIAIGPSKNNENREAKLRSAIERGFRPVSYLSTYARVIGAVYIGCHHMIFENNVIQPFVRIGKNSILWSGNHVGHHSSIGENCFITSHVVISGGCEIGNNTFIGVNSCLADHIKVGHHAVITMGSRVTKDIPDYGVWAGDELRNMKSTRLKL